VIPYKSYEINSDMAICGSSMCQIMKSNVPRDLCTVPQAVQVIIVL
jgi:hypothetical protein